MRTLRKLIRNEDGNFAIMFSVTMGALAIGIGATIDLLGMHNLRENLQGNLDSAALAAVVEVNYNGTGSDSDNDTNLDQVYAEIVAKTLEANNFDLRGATPEVALENGHLNVSATLKYDLQFGKLLKMSAVNVNAESQVTLPGGESPIEVALVLDNTESMNLDGKMSALRHGVGDFIDAIEESNSGSKIALVPFARYVDVGIDKLNEPWLVVPQEFDTDRTWEQATHTGGTCNIETRTRFEDGFEIEYDTEVCTGQTTTYETMHRVEESRWLGCVGVRSDGLHMVDGQYTNSDTKIPGLLHSIPREVTGYPWDLKSWCPHTVTPLTDNYQLLKNQIGELYGTDRTYIPMGLIWGQRILSPEAPFTEADTANPKRQIMVLMSDGENTAYLEEPVAGISHDNFETIPYIEDLNGEQQENGRIPPNTNEETAALCEQVKSEGIEIYTIAFKVNDAFTRNLLLNCASSPSNYFNAGTNSKLVQSFKDISDTLESSIRISR